MGPWDRLGLLKHPGAYTRGTLSAPEQKQRTYVIEAPAASLRGQGEEVRGQIKPNQEGRQVKLRDPTAISRVTSENTPPSKVAQTAIYCILVSIVNIVSFAFVHIM